MDNVEWAQAVEKLTAFEQRILFLNAGTEVCVMLKSGQGFTGIVADTDHPAIFCVDDPQDGTHSEIDISSVAAISVHTESKKS